MNLNERIKRWREWSGLSPEDAAAALRVSKQSLWNWETGKFSPTHEHLARFAEAVGISMPQFWGALPPKRRSA